jgi:hypothetical protein
MASTSAGLASIALRGASEPRAPLMLWLLWSHLTALRMRATKVRRAKPISQVRSGPSEMTSHGEALLARLCKANPTHRAVLPSATPLTRRARS